MLQSGGREKVEALHLLAGFLHLRLLLLLGHLGLASFARCLLDRLLALLLGISVFVSMATGLLFSVLVLQVCVTAASAIFFGIGL